jgi:hypothetical protein
MDKLNSNNIFSVRKKINTILDKLDGENVSHDDVENALVKLAKLDNKQLLDVLLKRLVSSNNDFYVANYILRELADETIIPNIVELIFNKSLPDEKKAILISLLDEMNVDLGGLNFNEAFDDIEKIGRMAVNSLLNELNNDYISLEKAIEWLYEIPPEARLSFIDAICESGNDNAFTFLQKLISSDDLELVKRVLKNLSRLTNTQAFTTISESLSYIVDPEIKALAERALRKLSFKGISGNTKAVKQVKKGQLYKVMATNIDGVGSQSLWISRYTGRKIECMFLLLNERTGIKDCFGNKMTKKQFDDMINIQFDEGIIINEIDYPKAVAMIKDALHINHRKNIRIAPAFHFLKSSILEETSLIPETFIPEFKGYNLAELQNDRKSLSETKSILSLVLECESWFIVDDYVYNIAEELLKGNDIPSRKSKTVVKPNQKVLKEVIKMFGDEEIQYFIRRLYLTADLLNSKKDKPPDIRNQVKILLCAALTLDKMKGNHPFLLAIADDSIYQAEISLLSGIDFRKNPEYFN